MFLQLAEKVSTNYGNALTAIHLNNNVFAIAYVNLRNGVAMHQRKLGKLPELLQQALNRSYGNPFHFALLYRF